MSRKYDHSPKPKAPQGKPAVAGAAIDTGKAQERNWTLGAIGVYTLFFLIVTSPVILGKAHPTGEARDRHYPSFVYAYDAISDAKVALWDPYTNSGYPFHADLESPTVNPVAALMGTLFSKSVGGFLAYWMFHWWLGGAGMILLARWNGATPTGALCAGVAYAMSGAVAGAGARTPIVVAAGYLPFGMALISRGAEKKSGAFSMAGGAVLGIAAHGGGAVGCVIAVATACAWTVLTACGRWYYGLSVWRQKSVDDVGVLARRRMVAEHGLAGGDLIRSAAQAVAIATCGFLVVGSGPIASYFIDGAGYTGGVHAPAFAAAAGGGLLDVVLQAFLPGAQGRSAPDLYVGAAAAALFAVWIAGGRNRFPATALLLAGWCATRFLTADASIAAAAAISLGAGFGLSTIHHRPGSRFSLAAGAGIISAAVFAAAFARGFGSIGFYGMLPAAVVGPVLCVSVLLALGDRGSEGVVALAAAILLADFSAHVYVARHRIWEGPALLKEAATYHQKSRFYAENPPERLLVGAAGNMNAGRITKKFYAFGGGALSDPRYGELEGSKFGRVLESRVRYWISPGAEWNEDQRAALAAIRSAGPADPMPAYTEPLPEGVPEEKRAPAGTYGNCSVSLYFENQVDLSARVPDGGSGLLCGTERWSPSWKAVVDGGRVSPRKTNLLFRGVVLPPGSHYVVFTYDPSYFLPLCGLGGAALVFSLAALLWRGKVRRA